MASYEGGEEKTIGLDLHQPLNVIAGLDPAIHDGAQRAKSVRPWPLKSFMDARVKPAHDELNSPNISPSPARPS
jgi:hypothetical protein